MGHLFLARIRAQHIIASLKVFPNLKETSSNSSAGRKPHEFIQLKVLVIVFPCLQLERLDGDLKSYRSNSLKESIR